MPSISEPPSLHLETLPAGSAIDVQTQSRCYRIECLGGNSIRISGHPDYCPVPSSAFLIGSIGTGKSMMFFVDGRPVTTSRVLSVRVASVLDPPSSSIN